jgi:hypothetical protein
MPDSSIASTPHPEVVAIRDYLMFAARHHQLVTPAQVTDATRVKSRVVQRLTELNRLEHASGHPLLAAIVTGTQPDAPSAGFRRLVRELFGESDDLQAFWQAERDRVWAFDWSK